MILYLVGYMGCGKSTMGRKLSSELGYEFADTDQLIEQMEGKRITDIFANSGQEYFRDLESDCIRELANRDNVVVATGGGLPCREVNMELMKRSGMTIYLKMSPGKLFTRLERGRLKRPLIKQMNDSELMSFIEKSVAAREPHYNCAKMIIDCDGQSDRYIVEHIVAAIKVVSDRNI